MLDMVSADMSSYLLPWYKEIQANGGLKGLGLQVGYYGMLYQTVIALFTYLPVKPIYTYKAFSVLFDYLLAVIAGRMVSTLSRSRLKGFSVCVLVLFMPTVCMNSALWGQCDSIFAFFCVLTVFLLLKNRYIWAFIAYGAALSFKLQAVFLLPFLLFYYAYEKRFSLVTFFIILPVMAASGIGGLIRGRPILDIIRIYLWQTSQYPRVSMNYPSFWGFLVPNLSEIGYRFIAPTAILTTLAVLLSLMIWLFLKKPDLTGKEMVFAAFLMCYSCVFFLPSMHERYSYIYVVFAALLGVLYPHSIPGLIGLVCIDMQLYGLVLFSLEPAWSSLVWINTACYCFYVLLFCHVVRSGSFRLDDGQIPQKRTNHSI